MLGNRKPGTELKRSRMPDRQAPIAKFSAGQRAGRGRQQQVYAAMDAEASGHCFTCNRWGPTDHSHILPQGMNKLERPNPLNIVADCRACHDLFGEKLPEYARRYPEALAAKVARMKLVNRQRWAFWMMKNEHLLNLK